MDSDAGRTESVKQEIRLSRGAPAAREKARERERTRNQLLR